MPWLLPYIIALCTASVALIGLIFATASVECVQDAALHWESFFMMPGRVHFTPIGSDPQEEDSVVTASF